jgi:hypothetical protein
VHRITRVRKKKKDHKPPISGSTVTQSGHSPHLGARNKVIVCRASRIDIVHGLLLRVIRGHLEQQNKKKTNTKTEEKKKKTKGKEKRKK